MRNSYNPALDGVRAVAVIAVIGFHWQIPGFWGGFLGVDVFFVLSGFLITSLILEEIDRTGTLSLSGFYIRRLLRLAPPLMLMLATYLAIAPILWGHKPFSEHALNAALGAFYLSDYALAFGPRPTMIPHTWSLSVEEHYYLIWPVTLLWLLPKLDGRKLILALVALYVASTAWRMANAWWFEDPLNTYARFDTRMSGLILGGIVAAIRQGASVSRMTANALALSGLMMIAVFCVTSQEGEFQTLTWRMTAIELGSAALIFSLACDREGAVAQALRVRPLVVLGLLSYGLYLWHTLIFFWLYPVLDPVPRFVVSTALTLAVAGASYVWIERPLRTYRRQRFSARPALV